MKDAQTIKSLKNKEEPTDILSITGLLVAMPILISGLFSQAYLSLKVEWNFHILALFSLALGLGGLLLVFSKLRKGIPYGTTLVCVSAALSILFAMNTDILKDTPITTLIVVGASLSAVFGAINHSYKVSG
jgi:hypothetical protein